MAPSQPAAAVAGVQLASRQHSSLVPFFQTKSPVPLRQLSMVCAPAADASAAEANNIATLFSFFMVFLLRGKAADALRKKDAADDRHPLRCFLLCHRRRRARSNA
jgi:hypothetical protein